MSHGAKGDRWRRLAASVVVFILLTSCRAGAAFEVVWPDARSAAMLGRSTLVSRLLEPAGGRPFADGRDRTTWRVTVSGGELYGLREAAGGAFAAEARWGGACVGGSGTTLGGDLYSERSLALGAGWSPGSLLSFALVGRAAGISASGTDDVWSTAVDVGVSRSFAGRVVLSACGENVGRAGIGGSPMTSRTRLRAALELDVAELSCSVDTEGGFDPTLTLGAEARPCGWLSVRAGAGYSPARFGAGLGFASPDGRWPEVDLACQWHPRLGVSAYASVGFRL